jgi:predicted nucleic acid-binding protein
VLGILLRAKKTGRIVSVKNEVDALRRRARFFVAPALEAEILRNAGE